MITWLKIKVTTQQSLNLRAAPNTNTTSKTIQKMQFREICQVKCTSTTKGTGGHLHSEIKGVYSPGMHFSDLCEFSNIDFDSVDGICDTDTTIYILYKFYVVYWIFI